MNKAWMPTVAGILAITSGCLKLLGVFGLMIAIIAVAADPYRHAGGVDPLVILLAIAIPLAVVGILSTVGGIYALLRRNWGLALAGSIAAVLPFSLLGVAALILTALCRDEFGRSPE